MTWISTKEKLPEGTNYVYVPETVRVSVIVGDPLMLSRFSREETCLALLNLDAGGQFLHGYYCQLEKGHPGMHRTAPLAQATDDAVVVLDWTDGTTRAVPSTEGGS